MSAEKPQFRKTIRPGPTKGSLVIETQGEASGTLKNPSKEKHIPAELLDNLKSLAVMAEADPADSADQEWLNMEFENLRRRHPSEQPKEVWKRTLATLMASGVDIESVAGALLASNDKFHIKMNLGDMTATEKTDRLENLKNEISKFWPSSPNLA